MNRWEAIYTHEYYEIGLIVTEQQTFEHNKQFDCTQVPTPPCNKHGLAIRINTQARHYSDQPNLT